MEIWRCISNDFMEALAKEPPGTDIIYYTGYLVIDREKSTVLDKMADIVWTAMMQGRVDLIQRRHEGKYQYIARVRPQPYNQVIWTGAYASDNWRLSPETIQAKNVRNRIRGHKKEVA